MTVMPCKTCGTELVFVGQWPGSPKCPRCDSIRIVARPLATKISNERLEYLDQLVMRYMKQFNKDQLIAHIVLAREKFSRSFFEEYGVFETSKFVSYSLLVRRLMAESNFSGTTAANEENTRQLIKTFSLYLGHRTEDIYLQDGFAELMAHVAFDVTTLTPDEKLSNFVVVYTEKFLPIHETFANNEIYDEAEGKRKYDEYAGEREEIKRNPPPTSQSKYTPQDYIQQNYSVLNSLYCGLLKNEIYAQQTFDFSNYKKASIIPTQVMDLVNFYPMFKDRPTIVDGASLRVQVDKIFDRDSAEIKKILIFNQQNQETFPLLVELNDRVLIPHRTAFLIFLLLHPYLHKDIFDAETQRRSKELEATLTKTAFEKAGFTYYPNLTDKRNATMEIDGIATRRREMHVIEVKGWGIGTYYEHKERQQWLIRDLKGIGDGAEYSTIQGQQRIKKKVSLPQKIEFVKKNMSIWGLSQGDYDSVDGIIVMKDYPPINEYRGIRIIGLKGVALE